MASKFTGGGSPTILTDLEVDAGTVSVDATNNRVGINTTSPTVALEIDGDIKLSPTAITTTHITTAGGMRIRAGSSLNIGDDGADSVRLGRINTGAAKVHIRSGADTDLVVSNSNVGVGVDDPDTKLEIFKNDTQLKLSFDASTNMTIGVDTNGHGSIVPTGGILGTPQLVFSRFVKGTQADGTTLTSTDSGAVIFQSTNAATINLPAAVGQLTGVNYTFVFSGTAGQGFNISPNASDKIIGSIVDVTNGNVVTAANNGGGTDNKDLILAGSSKVGDRVTLVCDGSTGWFILNGLGDWEFES